MLRCRRCPEPKAACLPTPEKTGYSTILWKPIPFERDQTKSKLATLASQGVFVGTSSWKYDTFKGKRDRAILAVPLYHGIRRSELTALRVCDLHGRRGVMHLTVHGKGDKIRHLPAHPLVIELVEEYLKMSGHKHDKWGAMLRPVQNSESDLEKPLSSSSVYRNVVLHYSKKIGLDIDGFGPHSLRATAATNALEHAADIAKVQEWLGHADISTTRL